jgi:hypothetical protein
MGHPALAYDFPSPHIDNSPVRQANYRIRRELLLADACCGAQAEFAVTSYN